MSLLWPLHTSVEVHKVHWCSLSHTLYYTVCLNMCTCIVTGWQDLIKLILSSALFRRVFSHFIQSQQTLPRHQISQLFFPPALVTSSFCTWCKINKEEGNKKSKSVVVIVVNSELLMWDWPCPRSHGWDGHPCTASYYTSRESFVKLGGRGWKSQAHWTSVCSIGCPQRQDKPAGTKKLWDTTPSKATWPRRADGSLWL